jgi:hypothetical protein
MQPIKNDGWTDIIYDFGLGAELNKRISFILNEACHVFYYHADGTWKSNDKDNYARQLAEEIRKTPSLIRKLIKLEDRVVRMVVFRAIELNKKVAEDDSISDS